MSEREKRDRVQGIPLWQFPRDGIWRADFRSIKGGSKVSLGTRDRTEAEERLAEKKRELEAEEKEDDQQTDDKQDDPLLKDFAQEHLDHKRDEVAKATWANEERALGYLTTYLTRELSHEPRLSDVTARRLKEFLQYRLKSVKKSTAGIELSGISSMLSRAEAWRYVDRNEAKYVKRPKTEHDEAVWLELEEAVRVLQAARAMEDGGSSRCLPYTRALLATYLLTGGRREEVFGLTWQDIDFESGFILFRRNQHRTLKNRPSKRRVPLWPQLRQILRARLQEEDGDPTGLLFPAWDGEMLTNIRSALGTVEEKAELEKHITPKVFRHTYTATRIQTLDAGEPVSLYTVARELGHKGISRIEDTYGHLQARRSRLPEVRYQVDDSEGEGIGEEA